MSHISLIRIKLKNPNRELLKKTVKELAAELKATITTNVKDFGGETTSVFIGIMNETFKNGIGINIDKNGEVQIVGDFWGVKKKEVENFQQKLIQRYTANALQLSLKQLGYQTQAQKVKEKIVVRAWSL